MIEVGHRVLVRHGRRDGSKGITHKRSPDGTVEVVFPIREGGGYESEFYMDSDLIDLGDEAELEKVDSFQTAYGPYHE